MKIQEFQNYLKKKQIDLAILFHPDQNITYFARLEPSHAFFLVKPTKADLYLSKLDNPPKIEGASVRNIPRDWKTVFFSEKEMKIGINKSSLTVAQLEILKRIYPQSKFVDVSNILDELRRIKTKQELDYIAKACKITSDAFDSLCKELTINYLKTEQDVAFFLEKYIKNKGCQLAFHTISAVGKNAAVPHHVTSTTRLKRGFLLVDFGARYNNYCADMTRMVFLGSPSTKEKQFYELLKKSQQAALDQIIESKKFTELDDVARGVLGKYAKNFIHSLGHGIGVEVHENPVFSDRTQKVEINVPFTVEPGIYFPGKFGLRIEDTVFWDGKKVHILTKATKKLISIKSFS